MLSAGTNCKILVFEKCLWIFLGRTVSEDNPQLFQTLLFSYCDKNDFWYWAGSSPDRHVFSFQGFLSKVSLIFWNFSSMNAGLIWRPIKSIKSILSIDRPTSSWNPIYIRDHLLGSTLSSSHNFLSSFLFNYFSVVRLLFFLLYSRRGCTFNPLWEFRQCLPPPLGEDLLPWTIWKDLHPSTSLFFPLFVIILAEVAVQPEFTKAISFDPATVTSHSTESHSNGCWVGSDQSSWCLNDRHVQRI